DHWILRSIYENKNISDEDILDFIWSENYRSFVWSGPHTKNKIVKRNSILYTIDFNIFEAPDMDILFSSIVKDITNHFLNGCAFDTRIIEKAVVNIIKSVFFVEGNVTVGLEYHKHTKNTKFFLKCHSKNT